MKMLSRHFDRGVAAPATTAVLTLGMLAAVPVFSTPVSAHAAARSCTSPVTSAPTGRATVSVATRSPFGRVLVIGSGAYAGCSLYLLTSDQLRAVTSGLAPFACSDGPTVIGPACDTTLWPALLTDGAPIAGAGGNRALLGTVARADVRPGQRGEQGDYARVAVFRFLLGGTAGETGGSNLFDPVT